jgi:uncharacterized membrane protein
MAGQTPTNTSSGIAFLVSAGIVYEIVAAACSSPQTTEINADTRADTLMKWVYLGLGQAAFFVVAAAVIDKTRAGPILVGGALAGGILYVSYAYAKQAGLASGESGTET